MIIPGSTLYLGLALIAAGGDRLASAAQQLRLQAGFQQLPGLQVEPVSSRLGLGAQDTLEPGTGEMQQHPVIGRQAELERGRGLIV